MKKKIIIMLSISLILVLIAIGLIYYLVDDSELAISKDQNPILTQNTANEAPVENKHERLFSVDAPIGIWDIPVPYINPLGSQSIYKKVTHEISKHQLFIFLDYEYNEVYKNINGEAWYMEVPLEVEPNIAILGFQQYILDLGGDIYVTKTEDKVAFFVKDQNDDHWWGEAKANNGLEIIISKQNSLQIGKAVTFNTKDYEDNQIHFVTTNNGTRFQTLKVTLPEGTADIKAEAEYKRGIYKRTINYFEHIYADRSNVNILNNLPQETGTMVWEIKWNKDNDPKEITFLLEEVADISPVKYGENIGALRVRGVPYGSVEVAKPAFTDLLHQDIGFNYNGDITPEGDTLFWLPAGYWNVSISPDVELDVSQLTNKLVPVNEGEMTIIDLPGTLKNTFASQIIEKKGFSEKGLDIIDSKDMGDTASITFTLIDPNNHELLPTMEETSIFENGEQVKIEKLERLKTLPSIVLLLDSSGSMKGQMDQTLTEAREFITGLPDNAFIQVIDFDTKIKKLEGTTKEDVLKALPLIKADGATTLYDSIIEGIEILKSKERPILVIFSDGVDSNAENPRTGSKASKKEVLEAVKNAKIPLFTIGFGAGHDKTTLDELAAISEGKYYSAKDQSALDNVFTAINNKIGNTFELTYQRPQKASLGDVPVVSIVIDTSGSMDMPPSVSTGWRLQKVKNLFHDFILNLPESSQVQLMNFSDYVKVSQVMTSGKAELLQALSELRAGGGTNIIGSLDTAYKTLKPVPSTKKILVYVTDAALKVDRTQQSRFEQLLKEIKEENIQVLWVGMGVDKDEDAFVFAAKQVDGEYVISEDSQVLEKAFTKILNDIQQMPPSEKIGLTINVQKRLETGDLLSFSDSELVSFSTPKNSNQTINPEMIRYKTGYPVSHYDKKLADLIYGSDVPSKDVQVMKRIPLKVKAQNQAMEINTFEAYYLNRLKGVEAPYQKKFMAIEMEMKNILPEQEVIIYPDGSGHPAEWVGTSQNGKKTITRIPYMIPSMTGHFFITINNEGTFPASQITWLAEKPITPPGENGIRLDPDETVRGVMIFIVPDVGMESAALQFYDTSYGHINLPLVGKIQSSDIPLESLPTKPPVNINDTFSLTLNAFKDVSKVQKIEATQNTTFRILEGLFSTNVQALLDVQPQERFLLQIQTNKGALQSTLHPITNLIPYGFMKPVMLAPGSVNKVRFAYQIPNFLKDADMELYGDTKGEDFILPISNKKGIGSFDMRDVFTGNGIELMVNSLSRLDELNGSRGDWVVADITFIDKQDKSATAGFENAFYLVRDDFDKVIENTNTQELTIDKATESKGLGNFGDVFSSSNGGPLGDTILKPDGKTNKLLYGVNPAFTVYDGKTRRGFIVYNIPKTNEKHQWTLKSDLFKELSVTVSNNNYNEKNLLVERLDYSENGEKFERQLSEALSDAISKYKMLLASTSTSKVIKSMNLDPIKVQKNIIPVPVSTYYGVTKFNNINTLDEFKGLMNELKWVPSSDPEWQVRYSPEAVITQGWGTLGDLSNTAEKIISRLGYRPNIRMVKVSDKGMQALKELLDVNNLKSDYLPAIFFKDQDGKDNLFVIPFMKDMKDLNGLVYKPTNPPRIYEDSLKAYLTVNFILEPISKSQNDQLRDIGNILGGGTSSNGLIEETVIRKEFEMDSLSLDAIDIGYAEVGDNKYTTVIDSYIGRLIGDKIIDSSQFRIVGTKIIVNFPNARDLVHQTNLSEDEDITSVFHTIGINLPDIQEKAAKALQKVAETEYKVGEKPSELSSLRWYNRNILNRFIVAQTEYEKSLAKDLELVTGRTSTGRFITVTVKQKDQTSSLKTSIDLVNSDNQIHTGSELDARAYNIMSGIFASRLEGAVLPQKGVDIFTVWEQLPEDSETILISSQTKSQDLKYMKNNNFPDSVINQIKNSNNNNIILIPSKPAGLNGENYWAWLEIDPKTYQTISVLETGERGAMIEGAIIHAIGAESFRDYFVGAFVGIDASIWAVSSFSLELTDYNQILKQAHQVALGIGARLKQFNDGKGKVERVDIVGPLKFGFDGNFQVKVDVMGFDTGYQDGVNYYFKKAGKK